MSTVAPVTEHAAIKPSHIIGIGASAGGLSALEQFFDNMPPNTGMAFVVIQHLSPDFKSLMDDLLSRHTSMPIYRVSNGIELQRDSIYLIPPKTHMTVRQERLYLTEKTISTHLELPIDIFFNSLAEDAGDRSVGVVLSGTGSDGSRGIVSINKNGGLVVVQTPESAQFDGMPRSAITTGVCDFILAPERIPRILVEYAVSPLAVRTRMHHELEVFEDEGEYAGIFALLRRGYNLDFSKYKGSTVGRRIRRRMEFRQIPEVSDYVTIVSGDQGELDLLYKDLLIGVTEFFRDKQAFEFLEQEVIPRLFANLQRGEDLRVWSAACATGEEAYSIAILLMEKAGELGFMGKITVFATDVHKTSLDFASQGLYDRARLTNVSPERLERFFKKEGGDLFRVTSELRKLVVFAPHNLLNDPPFTRLDLVCCRNLLIYFQTEVQEKVIALFHFALKIDRVLFLGSSEGLGAFTGEFEVIANQHKLFRKMRDLKLALNLDANRMERRGALPVTAFQPGSSRTVSIDRQVLSDYDTLLRRHIPPGVLIDENRQIVHYFGNVAEYLKMPEGRAETNILALSEDNLHIALSTSLQRADSTRQLVVTRNVRIKRGDGEFLIDLNISPLPDEKSHSTHYHVYFERVRPTEQLLAAVLPDVADEVHFDVDNHFRQHVADLEMELQSTRESLQTTVEELQTSNEELQATNEELLASNEELQSTNEELHSVNEELYSVNSEFERKNLELKQLNNDHENLLASTDIGTVFLDRQLRIRKYNPAIASFFKLLPQDIGRPIDHIAYHLSQQEEMLADINRVLQSGVAVEQEEETRDSRWLLRRIMPFRTETGQVEGVVITFTDITTVKSAELKVLRLNEELEQKVEERTKELKQEIQERLKAEGLLIKARDHYLNILAEAPALIWRADTSARCDWFNTTWLAFTGRSMEQEYGDGWVEGVHPDDLERCVSVWQAAFSEQRAFEMEYRLRRHDGDYRWLLDIGRPMKALDGSFAGYIGYCFDMTERIRVNEEKMVLEQQLQQSQKLESLGVLAGGIAHDFNNILAIIMGYCSLIQMNHTTAEINIVKIEKAADRAAGLCRQMLTYAGQTSFSSTLINVTELVDEMIKMLKSTISQNVVIHQSLVADIPAITGDASQIRQIVMNLVINAAEAIGEEQGVIRVSLSGTEIIAVPSEKDYLGKDIQPGRYLRLEIIDSGCGMDSETRRRIFEPFYTTKFTGRGLGMSAVLGIITAHKGALQLTSQPGQGTTFKIYLPIQEGASTRETLQQVSYQPWRGSGTILLVEDEEQVMGIVRDMLNTMGFNVIGALNGREALELYRVNAADITLVVTDLGMPIMDGYALFHELKKLKPELPIVISSGFGDIAVTSRIPPENVAGIVSKPYSFAQLQEVLKGVK
jgi:two-component system CheB/CheR fusion protein